MDREAPCALEINGKTAAYVRLPQHPGVLSDPETGPLDTVIPNYRGPSVVLDFSAGVLVGIEIVHTDKDESEAPETSPV